ncbi:hypothetical protein FH972_023789 [Carpinus fangiana]|uniref:GPI ethanolamine phosphate transferase 1 n=1 Tax=Carpinus fangiana TaxID=176857 RepID=A0A5N6KW68_9ROSI|nr:hypothetical protein FH972_023789 [Carpinus fangiana]
MAHLGRNGFLAIAVVFHLIYIYSIFDIYFVSPIVHGMQPFRADNEHAPAKRLVLFVGDGLRADKAFQSFPDPSPGAENSTDALVPRPLAPFLRSRVLEHGTFGVSHTRVPTESRPGHVALIAGLYEDVSAVTTGWKLNPVNFDSVFNRSRHTWSWGSPDILPMFEQGAVPGRVDADCYGAEAEDFTQDAIHLDLWVFDKVKELFKTAGHNRRLNEDLRKDKNVFFLHLLGLDTTGHSYRPYSKEYLHNIQVVDKGVREITDLVNSFYGDDKTAFVFTADHGMSDWGSHGDGHPDNTRTPLIAWGSGVAKPVTVRSGKAPGHEDGFSHDWGFDHVKRNDVAQADIAALMAYLAGLEFPTNSVGELPLEFLNDGEDSKAKAMLANAQGILDMYRVKEEQKRATELRFKPYGPLGDREHSVQARTEEIQNLITAGQYQEAISSSRNLIQLGLGGLRYLQTYDWLFLRTLVTAGYLGWIAFAIATVIDLHVLGGSVEPVRTTSSILGFSGIFVALCAFLFIQSSSLTYYGYSIFPVLFWEEVWARKEALVKGRDALLGEREGHLMLALKVVAYIGLIEALVHSYFHREIYTICYLAAVAWPAFYGKDFYRQNKILCITWAICCASMSSFTLLPANKVENIGMVSAGGVLMLAVGLLYLFYEKTILWQGAGNTQNLASVRATDTFSRGILGAQIGLIALAMMVTRSSAMSLQAKKGLPLGTQIAGWIVLSKCSDSKRLRDDAPNSPNISYEGLFYFAFCATVATWVRMEHHVHSYTSSQTVTTPPTKQSDPITPALKTAGKRRAALKIGNYRALSLADARISLFFLFLLQSAFFSTGNIASVSSFSLDAVYRLIPVFDPFSQGALLMLKIMIPFAVISANLGILNLRLGVPPSALFMVVMALTDVMTLNFFYMVKDEGSWLDIGTTISHFVIASMLCVFVAGLEFVSEVFVSGVEVESEHQKVASTTNGTAWRRKLIGKQRLTEAVTALKHMLWHPQSVVLASLLEWSEKRVFQHTHKRAGNSEPAPRDCSRDRALPASRQPPNPLAHRHHSLSLFLLIRLVWPYSSGSFVSFARNLSFSPSLTMGFLQKLTRSRSNSYVDEDENFQPASSGPKHQPQGQDNRPPTSYKSLDNNTAMYQSQQRPQQPQQQQHQQQQQQQQHQQQQQQHDSGYSSARPTNNGSMGSRGPAGRDSGYADDAPQTQLDGKLAAPDLLTRAFHESVRPYTDKIEALEQQLQDMQNFLDQMETQRMDIFAWIDKRGLRPDVPPQIAKQMDTTPDAASALNGQLDRKMTIVNFDLHRLQDDLNESISSAHFASAMAKFLPDIQRLADIPAGPRFAYELIIKLVGNLNSHGGLEAAGAGAGSDADVDEDRRARAAFYARMDEELVDVIGRRTAEGEDWALPREIKRLEKNGAYLKNLGIDSYFPRSLDVMRRQAESFQGSGASPPRY